MAAVNEKKLRFASKVRLEDAQRERRYKAY